MQSGDRCRFYKRSDAVKAREEKSRWYFLSTILWNQIVQVLFEMIVNDRNRYQYKNHGIFNNMVYTVHTTIEPFQSAAGM